MLLILKILSYTPSLWGHIAAEHKTEIEQLTPVIRALAFHAKLTSSPY